MSTTCKKTMFNQYVIIFKMKKPRINIIACVGKNRELGKRNELIWRIPADLKRVKDLTMGHPIIMGLNTYNSIGKPLPGRINIVLAFEKIDIQGCVVVTSLEDALKEARAVEEEEIFIFGGASVYHATITLADRLYLTLIDAADSDADAFFPDYSLFTKEIAEENHPEHTPPYTWLTIEK